MEEHPKLKKIFFPIEKCPFEWIDFDEMVEELFAAKKNQESCESNKKVSSGFSILSRWDMKQIYTPIENITDYHVTKYVTKSANEIFCINGDLENKCPDVISSEIDCEGVEAVPKKYSLPDETNEIGTYKFIVQRCNRFLEERDVLKRISKKLGQVILKTHDPNDVGYAFQFLQIENTTPKLIKAAFEEENWLTSDFKKIDAAENEFESFNYSKRRYQICIRDVKASENCSIEIFLLLFENNGFINYFSTESNCLRQFEHNKQIGQDFISGKYSEALRKIRQVNPNERSKWEMIRCAFSMSHFNQQIRRKYLDKAEKTVSDKNDIIWKSINEQWTPKNLHNKFFDNIEPQQIINYVDFTLQLYWNQMVNKIIESRGGLMLKPGDLVFVDQEAEKRVEEDEFGASVPTHSWIPGYYSTLVRPLTHQDIDSGKYTVYDWVLPIPGGEVKLPENNSKGLIKGIYYHGWRSEEKDVPLQTIGPVKIRGSYRKVLLKPEKFKWKLKFYTEDNEPLLLDDFTDNGRTHEIENLKREVDVSINPWLDLSKNSQEVRRTVVRDKTLKDKVGKRKRAKNNKKSVEMAVKNLKEEPDYHNLKWINIEEINGVKKPEGSKVALILDFHLQKKTSYLIALRQLLQNDTIFISKLNEHYDPNKIRYEDMAKLKQYVLDTSKVLRKAFKGDKRQEKSIQKQAKINTFQKLTPSGQPLGKDLAFVYTRKGVPNIYAIRKFMGRVKKAKGPAKIELEKKAEVIRKLVGPNVMKDVEHFDNVTNPFQRPHTKKVIKRACSKLLNVLQKDQQMSSQFSNLLDNVKELVKTVDEPSSSTSTDPCTSYTPQPNAYMYNNSPNRVPNMSYQSYPTPYAYSQQFAVQPSQYMTQYPSHVFPQTNQMIQGSIDSSNGNLKQMLPNYQRELRVRDSRERDSPGRYPRGREPRREDSKERSDMQRRIRERYQSPNRDKYNKQYPNHSTGLDNSNWRFGDDEVKEQSQYQFIPNRDEFLRDCERYSPPHSREHRSYRSPDRRGGASYDGMRTEQFPLQQRYYEARDYNVYKANEYNYNLKQRDLMQFNSIHHSVTDSSMHFQSSSYKNRIDDRNRIDSRSDQRYLTDSRHHDRSTAHRPTSSYTYERRSYRSPSPDNYHAGYRRK